MTHRLKAHRLKGAWFHFNPRAHQSGNPVSKFAFKWVNLFRYNTGPVDGNTPAEVGSRLAFCFYANLRFFFFAVKVKELNTQRDDTLSLNPEP
jgi:hypothetical protein